MANVWSYRAGILLVTVSAVFWSTAGFFTRLISLDVWTMLFWRGVFGALGLLVFIAIYERKAGLRHLLKPGLPGWFYAAISAIGMLCFITSLRLTSVAHVAIIYATAPFVAAGLAWLAVRERASMGALAASLLAFGGVLLMVGLGGDGTLPGDVLAFAMMICLAIMIVIARKYPAIPTLQAACLSSLLSAVAVWPMAASFLVVGDDWFKLAAFGLMNSAVGLALFTIGSRLLPPVETALIGALDAPLAPIWVWLAFSETPALATIIGYRFHRGAWSHGGKFHFGISRVEAGHRHRLNRDVIRTCPACQPGVKGSRQPMRFRRFGKVGRCPPGKSQNI